MYRFAGSNQGSYACLWWSLQPKSATRNDKASVITLPGGRGAVLPVSK